MNCLAIFLGEVLETVNLAQISFNNAIPHISKQVRYSNNKFTFKGHKFGPQETNKGLTEYLTTPLKKPNYEAISGASIFSYT